MRTLTLLAAAATLAATASVSPAHAATTAAVLTCDLHMGGLDEGGLCNLVGVAGGDVYALETVEVDILGRVPGLCGVNGTAVGTIGAPVNALFEWTWVGPAGVLTLSGGTTGVGVTEMVLVTGDPCFNPDGNDYLVVMELAGI